MENFNIDFISIVIGYFIGISLMYSIQTTMFLNNEDKIDVEENHEKNNIYGWNYPYDQ